MAIDNRKNGEREREREREKERYDICYNCKPSH